jgi:hypothetical protein
MYTLNIYTVFYHENIVQNKSFKFIVFATLLIISTLKNISDLWFISKAFIILLIYIKSFVANSKVKKFL